MLLKTINKIVHEKKELDFLISDLKINNENFSIYYSSAKVTVENGFLKYSHYLNKLNKSKGLYFIKKLKTYIVENQIKYSFNYKIGYNKLNTFLKKNFIYKKDLYEVDLKAAYWYFAKKNEFISEDIFKEGLKIDKRIRLMALGALAKSTNVFDYIDGELIKTYEIKNELTEGIFFKVAYDTDLIMRKLIHSIPKNDFCFYWVDAIFFRGKKNLEIIKKVLKEEQLNYKIVEIKKMQRKDSKFTVEDFDYKRRDFNFIKQNNFTIKD